jgi:M6 family metalloprotease-like protein
MVNSFLKPLFLFLFITGTLSPLYSIIVWEGTIVQQWPDEAISSQHVKRSETSSSHANQSGFGLYPQPKGKMYGIAMVVDFSDQPAKFTQEQLIDWLNKPGFSMGRTKGSVRDYYLECSNGQVDLNHDVVGYYRAKKPKSYYENASGYGTANELIREMIDYFDPLVDFSKYDNDKNGTTEAISFVYAGSGKTWGKGIWPHSGYIGIRKDGVRLGRYNMCDMGNSLTIYVFCHEVGHMIFAWPDLYWFGDYCLMGNRMSDVNPQAINDFFRADQGWIPCETINSKTNKVYQSWHNKTGYRYLNPRNRNQMYFWSIVKNFGRWNNIKGRGLLLYKFDKSIDGNKSGTSRCFYVVEADGNNDLARAKWPNPGSRASDFFHKGNKPEFSSSTNPASSWGLRIYNISSIADTMSFTVGTGAVTNRKQYKMYLSSNGPTNKHLVFYNALVPYQ